MPAQAAIDAELEAVKAEILKLDPNGIRTAQVLRDTFDQLYDGQRTGRYRVDQLHKTEKTHCGTLVEINLTGSLDSKTARTWIIGSPVVMLTANIRRQKVVG